MLRVDSILWTLLALTFAIALREDVRAGQDPPPLMNPTEEDRQAFSKFRLTAEILTRMESFNHEGRDLLKRDPSFRAEWEKEAPANAENDRSLVKAAIQRIRSLPRVETLLRKNELTVDDYVLAAYTIMLCNWTIPPDSDSGKTTLGYVPPENVAFFIKNRARAVAMLEQTPAL